MENPWEFVEKHAERNVRLSVGDISISDKVNTILSASCDILPVNGVSIRTESGWMPNRSIIIDTLPLTISFGTFKSPGNKDLIKYVFEHVERAVLELLENLSFTMTTDGIGGDYPHPQIFNYRITCKENPGVNVVHERQHSDFFLHWKHFFEPDSPIIPMAERKYAEYYEALKREAAV